jgi:hypothetical protein
MAARSLWLQQLRQQSVRVRVISTALILTVLTLAWLRATVYHPRHESWTTPLIWTILAAYLIWNQFRRPKNSPVK